MARQMERNGIAWSREMNARKKKAINEFIGQTHTCATRTHTHPSRVLTALRCVLTADVGFGPAEVKLPQTVCAVQEAAGRHVQLLYHFGLRVVHHNCETPLKQ